MALKKFGLTVLKNKEKTVYFNNEAVLEKLIIYVYAENNYLMQQ